LPQAHSSALARHWTDYVLSILAMVISGLSLWIAIDTENTNRQIVQESSWPFLQIYNSGIGAAGQKQISLNVLNAGIGPAKLETLEVFWRGKAYRSSAELLKDCCGYVRDPSSQAVLVTTSTLPGTVLRPGAVGSLITFNLPPGDATAWNALNAARGEITYRACYCSVFNECWLTDGANLNPPRVKVCPKPKVAYDE
jgi:hypothetical protein